MPDEGESQVESQLKTRANNYHPTAKRREETGTGTGTSNTSHAQVRPSPHAQAAQAARATPKAKQKASKPPDEDSNYQWPDGGVLGGPVTALLADDEEKFFFSYQS
jgi:hypothetical protein